MLGGDDDHEYDADGTSPRTATSHNRRRTDRPVRRPPHRLEQHRSRPRPHPAPPPRRHTPHHRRRPSVRGATLTGTAARGDQAPPLHPLVQDFLDTLTSSQRDRFTGRCAETILISRHLAAADAARTKRAARKPMTNGEARKALKGAKLTARRIREDGDPLHGSFATPCRACTALSAHFGVRIVDPAADD